MDDFTLTQAWPQTPSQVNRSLIDLFDKHGVRIILFVTASHVEDPSGRKLLNEWVDAGHTIGNHTYSHHTINARDRTLKDFETDVLEAEKILQPFATYQRIFRFPALKEGNSVEVRDGMRDFLRAHGFFNGRVTVDASDWYYAERLQSRLRIDPAFDASRFMDPYVQHIRDRSLYYDNLAREVLGRSPRHTLLVHYSFLNSQFLRNVLDMYRVLNWRVISSSDAFRDPVFRAEPKTVPAGESLIWALAKETGRYDGRLRYPGEDDIYEKPKLDQLGL
ncbi:MAG: polysaccharide deacetylase family protein [Acidobacteriaceae bacterium]|nr:polysaccharide deacetylase family protein [Acidobacteriaceae bacterium]